MINIIYYDLYSSINNIPIINKLPNYGSSEFPLSMQPWWFVCDELKVNISINAELFVK